MWRKVKDSYNDVKGCKVNIYLTSGPALRRLSFTRAGGQVIMDDLVYLVL